MLAHLGMKPARCPSISIFFLLRGWQTVGRRVPVASAGCRSRRSATRRSVPAPPVDVSVCVCPRARARCPVGGACAHSPCSVDQGMTLFLWARGSRGRRRGQTGSCAMDFRLPMSRLLPTSVSSPVWRSPGRSRPRAHRHGQAPHMERHLWRHRLPAAPAAAACAAEARRLTGGVLRNRPRRRSGGVARDTLLAMAKETVRQMGL